MDKRTVIAAYRQGLINIRECAQIIGLDTTQMERMLGEIKPQSDADRHELSWRAGLSAGK
ncbi:hypothetical protein PUW24_24655 [Paenibacillus urinalis]|uniref:Uncharacterized protein n=1 Tax=Paenibacillus urinalis TaxID=521520 RepID=A0AAX3MVY3_9BACL|nr:MULTISPECIES: hypothetical protein [Paenibacillus]WDH81233.1 hypothetical protein PUW23_17055 [Paenibacillus urinalis]WDH97284.1 hypothetical protein PUW24_24655 [Paenibacillus urinalis]WDI00947.1 hypothetical protein PUW25_16880 [Paenibacillus urinalis]GAK40009.1 hypothetical protein TCA2_2498 [Paenibacillus sp. TCA20]